MVIFVEIYIYFRVTYLLESCHGLYFSIFKDKSVLYIIYEVYFN